MSHSLVAPPHPQQAECARADGWGVRCVQLLAELRLHGRTDMFWEEKAKEKLVNEGDTGGSFLSPLWDRCQHLDHG